jgi:hypothetical protein
MPSDEMLDISPPPIIPTAGKGALGTWRFPERAQTQSWGLPVPSRSGTRPACKPDVGGVYMSQHLSFPAFGKAAGGQAKVRTGLGKSDRPGS